MFAVERTKLVERLRLLRAQVCVRLRLKGIGWENFGGALAVYSRAVTSCDCKYGIGAGSEQTGCPEVRLAAALLAVMTDAEYETLGHRAGADFLESLR